MANLAYKCFQKGLLAHSISAFHVQLARMTKESIFCNKSEAAEIIGSMIKAKPTYTGHPLF